MGDSDENLPLSFDEDKPTVITTSLQASKPTATELRKDLDSEESQTEETEGSWEKENRIQKEVEAAQRQLEWNEALERRQEELRREASIELKREQEVVDKVFGFDEVVGAHKYMESN